VIVFAPATNSGLQRVAAEGGVPQPVTQVEGGGSHRYPVFLPEGGRYFFYWSGLGTAAQSGIHWASVDSAHGRRVLPDTGRAVYVPPAPGNRLGHLLLGRENTLMAQPFDAKTMQPAGELFPVAEQVLAAPFGNTPAVSVSENGVLIFQTGRNLADQQLTWFDRSGKTLGKLGAPRRLLEFALSPDEKTLAESRPGSGTGIDIWLYEVARGADSRFTVDPAQDLTPVWSPDGRRLAFSSDRVGPLDLYIRSIYTSKTLPDRARTSCCSALRSSRS